MVTTVQKWGNSQGIRIPKMMLESLGIRENDKVEITQSDEGLHVKKVQTFRHRTLEERLEEFYHKPLSEIERSTGQEEWDWGNPVGDEL